MTVGIWTLFAISAAVYWYVSRSFMSQADWNVPAIYRNRVLARLLVIAPQAGFLLVPILGFLFTDHGWWYLGAVVAAVIVLAPSRVSY
jgi:hypothetical protein